MARILVLGAVVIVVIAAAFFVVRWARAGDHGDEEEAPQAQGRERTAAPRPRREGGDDDWSAADYRSPHPIRGKYAAPSPGVRPGGAQHRKPQHRNPQQGSYGAQDGYASYDQQPAGRGGYQASEGYAPAGAQSATARYATGGYDGTSQQGYQPAPTEGYSPGSYPQQDGYGSGGYPANDGYGADRAGGGYDGGNAQGYGAGTGPAPAPANGYSDGNGYAADGGYPPQGGGYRADAGPANGYAAEAGYGPGQGYGQPGGHEARGGPAGYGPGDGRAPAPAPAAENHRQDDDGGKKKGRRFGLRRHDDDEIWPDDGVSDEDYWASVATERSLPSTSGQAGPPALPAAPERGQAGRLSGDPRQAQRPAGVPSTGSVRFGPDDPRGGRAPDPYGRDNQPRGPYPRPYGERDDPYGRGRR